MSDKMTIFYRKSNKKIMSISSQITDFRSFGELADDYKLIYDYIIVDVDDFVKFNPSLFMIEDGKIKLIDSLKQYL